jgi:hypothetical protein
VLLSGADEAPVWDQAAFLMQEGRVSRLHMNRLRRWNADDFEAIRLGEAARQTCRIGSDAVEVHGCIIGS